MSDIAAIQADAARRFREMRLMAQVGYGSSESTPDHRSVDEAAQNGAPCAHAAVVCRSRLGQFLSGDDQGESAPSHTELELRPGASPTEKETTG